MAWGEFRRLYVAAEAQERGRNRVGDDEEKLAQVTDTANLVQQLTQQVLYSRSKSKSQRLPKTLGVEAGAPAAMAGEPAAGEKAAAAEARVDAEEEKVAGVLTEISSTGTVMSVGNGGTARRTARLSRESRLPAQMNQLVL
jgi:hypothetical protein